MVYVVSGKGEPVSGFAVSAIDPAAPNTKPNTIQPTLHYWPDIRQLSPQQRYEYLAWLAQGRLEIPANTGYLFIFYYGLEHRALVEGKDIGLIFGEILRLLELNESSPHYSGSVQHYGTQMLWYLAMTQPKEILDEQIGRLLLFSPEWQQESAYQALYWYGFRKKFLPDWAAYQIAMRLPLSRRGVMLKRLGDEHEKVFIEKFRASFPDDMPVLLTDYDRQFTKAVYQRAAAGQGTLNALLPGFCSADNVTPLSTLWNEAFDALRSLDKLKKTGEQIGSLKKWEAMPAELRKNEPHPLTDKFFEILTERCDAQGFSHFLLPEIAGMLEIEERTKLVEKDAMRLVETAGYFGYSVEPDVRLSGESYRWEDGIMLFLSDPEDHLDLNRYRAAACMTRLGMSVAYADKSINPDEVNLVVKEVCQAFQLNSAEQRRLEALARLLSAGLPDADSIGKLIKLIAPSQRELVGKFLLYIIAADGVITKDEIRVTRSAFIKLGFTREEFERQLSAISAVSDDEAVTVQRRGKGKAGEILPPTPAGQPLEKGDIKLNYTAIASILAESHEAARILAEAMGASQSDIEQPMAVPAAPAPLPATPDDKPPRYAEIYEKLIVQKSWAMVDVDRLARDAKIPLRGALEQLNEWATEKFGGPMFIEDGDNLLVEVSYLN
jgi:hypothetical protein